MKVQLARVPYTTCPLCDAAEAAQIGRASCTAHPLYHDQLPDTITWQRCGCCGHVYTDGWFDGEGTDLLFAKANPGQVLSKSVEAARRVAARIVTTVSTLRGSLEGRWLDVGCGNGALVATASEFGYVATGIDLRSDPIERLAAMDYDARVTDLADLAPEPRWDVISMADVLEHMPFPRPAIEKARDLLAPGGVLFVSSPNSDSLTWRVMDSNNENPYWAEIEHYHNFDRVRLYALLSTAGMRPCFYGVSERYLAGMEVCAVKAD